MSQHSNIGLKKPTFLCYHDLKTGKIVPIALNCCNDGVHLINSFLNNRLLFFNNLLYII